MVSELEYLRRYTQNILPSWVNWFDIFYEKTQKFEMISDDSVVKHTKSGFEQGIGIRLNTKHLNSMYVFTEDISDEGITKLIQTVANLLLDSRNDTWRPSEESLRTGCLEKVSNYQNDTMIELIRRLSKESSLITDEARDYDSSISSVRVKFHVLNREWSTITADGLVSGDHSQQISATTRSTSTRNEISRIGWSSANTCDPNLEFVSQGLGIKSSSRAMESYDSRAVEPGVYPVVLAQGTGGLLFHEACGHALEADSVLKGSIYAGAINQKIGSEKLTLIDSPQIEGGWGSYRVDDEGSSCAPTVLVENGKLRAFMHDQQSASLLGSPTHGNARRASYKFPPMPRMSNTYLCAGAEYPQEIISSTKLGIYAVEFRGGQANPFTGDFSFYIEKAYMIRDGKISEPLDGVTLFGNSKHVLSKVDSVGNDLLQVSGECSKLGQTVRVGIGQPTVRLSDMFVAGSVGR